MTTMPTQILVQPITTMVDNATDAQNPKSISPGTPSPTSTKMNSPSEKSIASTVINGREARNLAEKQRRDKLNASIGELAKMVPHVADSPRRLDKTTVLRYATHGLRLQYVFGKTATRRKAVHKFDNSLMTNMLLHLIDSFFITLTCHGQIVLISSSVEHLLGHCQSDLYGQNLLQITHPDDQEKLQQELIPSDIESLFLNYHNSSKSSSASQQNDPSPNVSNEQDHSSYNTLSTHQTNECDRNDHHVENTNNFLVEVDDKLRADKRCFTVRLARASSRSESKKIYEIVKIDGCFRRSDFSALATGSCSYPIVSQLIRRSRNSISSSVCGGSNTNNEVVGEGKCLPNLMQHNAIAQAALYGVSGNDIVLVAMARIIRPAKIMNCSLEANRLEYKTRHLIDGRIVDCDNRIGLVAGYLKDEVRNLCPFSFMHQDDVRWVIVALRQMYDSNSDYGESCYRLLSRNGSFIYLNTKGYLEIDKSTNKVHSFICVNTLLDEEEGKQKVQEMKNKFSIIINAKVPTNTMQDVPASQNPQQLERIVLYLIENLQKRQTNSCVVDEIHSEDDVKRHATASHFSLVAPEPDSVKSSISKSVSVIIAAAPRSFEAKSYIKENEPSTNNTNKEIFIKTEDKINTSTQATFPQHETILHRPSVLQMKAKQASQEVNYNLSSPDYVHKNAQHISLLKRMRIDNSSTTVLNGDGECCIPQPVKRSLYNSSKSPSSETTCLTTSLCSNDEKNDTVNFHDFISSSLRHVGESLNCIDVQTSNLRQNCSSLPYSLDNKLDAIIIERKKQNKFLFNIKNEYDVYREHQSKFLKFTQNSKQKRNQYQKSSSPDKL